MATVKKQGGKRKIWFTRSTGKINTSGGKDHAVEVKTGSPWVPGRSKNKSK